MAKEQKDRLLSRYYNFLKKHIFIYAVIAALPATWHSFILKYFGAGFKLTSSGDLTLLGLILTIIISVLPILIVVTQNLLSRLNNENEALLQLYYQLSTLTTEVCHEKLECLSSVLGDVKQNQKKRFSIISNPQKQIDRLLDSLTKCIINTTDMKKENIKVSLAYQDLPNGHWQWCQTGNDGGLPLSILTKNESTTFHLISSGQEVFKLHNCKMKAAKIREYKFDSIDKSSKNIGSIVCANISVESPNCPLIKAVLSISTYGKKFVPNDNEAQVQSVEDNFKYIILPVFFERLKIELTLLNLKIRSSHNDF